MNTIRTPKQGTNERSRRIAQAVDDQEWQGYRLGMKGQSTATKLILLLGWYEGGFPERHSKHLIGEPDAQDCDNCIQVDNYLKALARGGQLNGGVTLAEAVKVKFYGLEVLK